MDTTSLLIIGGIIAIIVFLYFQKENYSGFRRVGRMNQCQCQQYYLANYLDCIKNSGGKDVNGDCWAYTQPRLFRCVYSGY